MNTPSNEAESSVAKAIDAILLSNNVPKSTLEITFDPSRHTLGNLCDRGHRYQGENRSVRGLTHRNCMVCMRLRALVWRRSNIEKARATDSAYWASEHGKKKRKEAIVRWRAKEDSVLRKITWGAQKRSKDKGLPCDLTIENCIDIWLQQGKKCYWTGVEFTMHGPDRHPLKPSLDRLKPELGYVMGNVVLATNFINRARGDTPADEFARILDIFKTALHTR